ncbi:hypothetical protein [Streptomyces sp. NPDC056987]|uniref:hypothetical protein n=1 Tax=Streptomyces sp. NPDC056987 TaxID=3345988 RepID=UPI003636E9DF
MDELPQMEIDGGEWYRSIPPPAIPMPAAHVPDLHGARAMAAAPGIGLLHDLRVLGDAHRDSEGTWANLVPELDYWRTQISRSTVTPRRVPIEHVYVEHRLDHMLTVGDPPVLAGDANALLRRLTPRPEQPGARTPVPARTVAHLHGRRIIQVTPLGFSWDLRAISEPYENSQHDIVLNVTSAHDYYRWLIAGVKPDPVPIGLYLLWTE